MTDGLLKHFGYTANPRELCGGGATVSVGGCQTILFRGLRVRVSSTDLTKVVTFKGPQLYYSELLSPPGAPFDTPSLATGYTVSNII